MGASRVSKGQRREDADGGGKGDMLSFVSWMVLVGKR